MNIRQTTDIQAFAERALPFLCQRPAEHNLILVLMQSLLESPTQQPPALITVDQDKEVVAVALQTAARPLVLSRMTSPTQVSAIAHHIKNCWPSKTVPLRQSLSQFGGPKAETALFAKTLRRWTGLRYQVQLAMQIHQLQPENLSMEQGVMEQGTTGKGAMGQGAMGQGAMGQGATGKGTIEGELRLATGGDRDRLIDWSRAFEQEAQTLAPENHEQWVDQGLADGSLYLWQIAAGPVCMLAGRPNTYGEGGRIGPVYTPPLQRCRGYATAATAALSQRLFQLGCRSCYLFTEVNNAAANQVYSKVGYELVGDWSEYRCQD